MSTATSRKFSRLWDLRYVFCFFAAAWFVVGWFNISAECNFVLDPKQQSTSCRLFKVVYDWQTILAGLFAIGAAIIGGFYIRQQIQHAERLAEDRRQREEKAAVAVMPLALSELAQYARDCIQFLLLCVPNTTAGSYPTLPATSQAPRIPDNAVTPLQTCARFADPENSNLIAKALSKLQVQEARLRSWVLRHNGEEIRELARMEGLGCIRDAAELHAAIEDLFRYARDEDLLRQKAPLSKLTSALHSSGLWDEGHPIWKILAPAGESSTASSRGGTRS